MDIHDLDDSYLTNYVQNIYKVTPEQVQEMTQKYLDPEKMTLIMVGDKESIEQQMKEYSRTNEAYWLYTTLNNEAGSLPAFFYD